MIFVKANLLTETGRPTKLLIPPHSTRSCPVHKVQQIHFQEVKSEAYVTQSLARRSLFLVQTGPLLGSLEEVLLHNGGWENQWIEHDETVVNVHVFRA